MATSRTTFLACLMALTGCGRGEFTMSADQQAILRDADQIALLSLQPGSLGNEPADGFHGYEVLGRATLKGAERARIVGAFLDAADESDGTVAACFEPRHGIRAIRDRETVDFVICFECLQVAVYAGDEEAGYFTITDTPLPVFNETLRDAGIPVAPSFLLGTDSHADESIETE
ncbi:MAG: hypothetical protein WBC44_07270 [Planctomycetaceae bacterium]